MPDAERIQMLCRHCMAKIFNQKSSNHCSTGPVDEGSGERSGLTSIGTNVKKGVIYRKLHAFLTPL
jgi:hypothetical protein